MSRHASLNRILDTAGSQILGKLNASGQVWLINHFRRPGALHQQARHYPVDFNGGRFVRLCQC